MKVASLAPNTLAKQGQKTAPEHNLKAPVATAGTS
jgi:hypothetical protein